MIYRHYKGGLYFVEGYAMPFSDAYDNRNEVIIKFVTKAKIESTLEDVDVFSIYDSGVKSMYHFYKSESLSEIMILYSGIDGQYWLRPNGDFYSKIDASDNISIPRFEKVSERHLFETYIRTYS